MYEYMHTLYAYKALAWLHSDDDHRNTSFTYNKTLRL